MLVAETQMESQSPTVVPRKGRPGRKGRLLSGGPSSLGPGTSLYPLLAGVSHDVIFSPC